MVLTVHHLQVSQSERVVWLCEELGLQYELKNYPRSPLLAPEDYKALHPIGSAPVIQDGDVKIAESGACVEYIINVHGNGKFALKPTDKDYAEYLYWLHFVNGSLQPSIGRGMTLQFAGVDTSGESAKRFVGKIYQELAFVDKRLGETGAWLAGSQFSAADIMIMFTLSTMRKFYSMDLSEYKNILAYFQRVTEREGYQRAMKKGDPEIDVQSITQGPSPPLFDALLKMQGGK